VDAMDIVDTEEGGRKKEKKKKEKKEKGRNDAYALGKEGVSMGLYLLQREF
jgi:hypothetical protein